MVIDYDALIKTNERLLFIIGVALPFIIHSNHLPEREERIRKWILQSLDSVIYGSGELPSMEIFDK